jgi:hypothetical protein
VFNCSLFWSILFRQPHRSLRSLEDSANAQAHPPRKSTRRTAISVPPPAPRRSTLWSPWGSRRDSLCSDRELHSEGRATTPPSNPILSPLPANQPLPPHRCRARSSRRHPCSGRSRNERHPPTLPPVLRSVSVPRAPSVPAPAAAATIGAQHPPRGSGGRAPVTLSAKPIARQSLHRLR